MKRLRKEVSDFFLLLWGQLILLREEWFWYTFQVAFAPLSMLFFLWFFVGRDGPERMLYVVTGSLVSSVAMGSMLSLGQHLGMLKDRNAYEHYAMLPISRITFVASLATRGVLLALPSALVVLVVGSFLMGMVPNAMVILVLLLSGYSLAGLGAFIGFWSSTAQMASLTTQILQAVLILFAPVYLPADLLPLPLRVISLAFPTTHAATALRASLSGESLEVFWPQLAVLAGFACLSLWLVPRRLDWRGNK